MAHYVAHLVIPTALDQVPLAEHAADGAAQCLGAIGSEGGLPLPSAHTTVRTVPYTAVQVLRSRSRS